MQLYIIRHGESVNNALVGQNFDYDEYMATRSPDPALTKLGRRQAEIVAAHIVNDDYGITEVHCSAMVRAMQTAQPIGRALGLQPNVWLDIHEHGGMFQGNPRNGELRSFPGLTQQEAREQFPGYQLPDAMGPEGWYQGGYEDMDGCDVRARRVADALQARAVDEPDAVVALVSHGTFIDRLLKALFGQTSSRHFYFLNNTALTRLDFSTKGTLVLRFANRIGHLPEALISQ